MRTWEDWKEVHQPFELDYHTKKGIPWCEDAERFQTFWQEIFDFIGQTKGEKVDIGCGPRPPFGKGTVIDPLADAYRELKPEWWEDITSYSLPAEKFIPELEGAFDLVLSWNCLDHTIGWQKILSNIRAYARGIVAIATDFKVPHIGHPGFERADFFKEVAKHFEIVKYQESFQERDIAMVLK